MSKLGDFLFQYKALLVEIEDKEKRLRELRSCIAGKTSEITKVRKNIKISNKEDDDINGVICLEEALHKSLNNCLCVLAKIEDFIRKIPDSRDRVILFNRYIKGQTWFQIANCLGFASESAPRKRFTRIRERLNLE